jgi:hypothetical protein
LRLKWQNTGFAPAAAVRQIKAKIILKTFLLSINAWIVVKCTATNAKKGDVFAVDRKGEWKQAKYIQSK